MKLLLPFLLASTGLCQTTLTVDEVDLANREQVLDYLQTHIADDEAIVAFYQRVGDWDEMRELRHLDLPQEIWNHLADARTRLVKQIYADVHAAVLEETGVFLTRTDGESYFIGTPPGNPNFKGVFSDLDVGMLPDREVDPNGMRAALSIPMTQAILIDGKRRMETELAKYAHDSGVLFDTNLYTTPEARFPDAELDAQGRATLDRYDDVLAYLALRVGCGPDAARWLDLKQRLLVRALERAEQAGGAPVEPVEPWVRGVVAEAEAMYAEFETIKSRAVAAAQASGQPVFEGLGDQAVTRHYEDRMLAFIGTHGDGIAADPALRAQFNMLKADYEASLRESYFTDAAQTYIVKWRTLGDAQKQEFLADPNHVRRVRADQARFILHYLHEPAGTAPAALRFKVQKIAKYEQRALNVLRDSHGAIHTMPGFESTEVLDLFSRMKGKTTPEEAWVVWRAANFNRLQGRDLYAEVPAGDVQAAEEYATLRGQAYLEHIEEKLVDIATALPVLGPAGVTEASASATSATVRWQNSSERAVLAFRLTGASEEYLDMVRSGGRGECQAAVGERFEFRDASTQEATFAFTVSEAVHTAEVGPTDGLVAYDADGLPALEIRYVDRYQWVYDDHDTGADMDCSVWRLVPEAIPAGFHPIGHLMLSSKGSGADPTGRIAMPVVRDIAWDPQNPAVRSAVARHLSWTDSGSGGTHDVGVFALEAPAGYVSLGNIVSGSLWGGDDTSRTACVRADLTTTGRFYKLWSEYGAGADDYFKAYGVEAPTDPNGYQVLACGGFVGLRRFYDGVPAAIATAPDAGFYDEATIPAAGYAAVLNFRTFDQ